jgi:hypothetical protein
MGHCGLQEVSTAAKLRGCQQSECANDQPHDAAKTMQMQLLLVVALVVARSWMLKQLRLKL